MESILSYEEQKEIIDLKFARKMEYIKKVYALEKYKHDLELERSRIFFAEQKKAQKHKNELWRRKR